MKVIDMSKRAIESAGLEPATSPAHGAVESIEKVRSAAGLGPRGATAVECTEIIDTMARCTGRPDADAGAAPRRPKVVASSEGAGEFVSRSFRNTAGRRTYKLYVPPGDVAGSGGTPLVVMLHGCKQSPHDFAAGTRMNELADKHGFLVAYPEQVANVYGSKCWNWFRRGDQGRDRGEPSIIAGITCEVAAEHSVDPDRIFVAGLSAGAAMAVILGVTYPELYAAVGAHSGLPYGAAYNMLSALGAMNGSGTLGGAARPSAIPSAGCNPSSETGVPTIVFHGDKDRTVHARNGAAIVEQATAGRTAETRLRASVREGLDGGGRRHRQTIHADAAGRPVVEKWDLFGAGHAWSGGSPDGSFTDAAGPDASAEMVRFFSAQPRLCAA